MDQRLRSCGRKPLCYSYGWESHSDSPAQRSSSTRFSAVWGPVELIRCIWGSWQLFFREISQAGKQILSNPLTVVYILPVTNESVWSQQGFFSHLVSRTVLKLTFSSALALSLKSSNGNWLLWTAFGTTWCDLEFSFPLVLVWPSMFIKVTHDSHLEIRSVRCHTATLVWLAKPSILHSGRETGRASQTMGNCWPCVHLVRGCIWDEHFVRHQLQLISHWAFHCACVHSQWVNLTSPAFVGTDYKGSCQISCIMKCVLILFYSKVSLLQYYNIYAKQYTWGINMRLFSYYMCNNSGNASSGNGYKNSYLHEKCQYALWG